MRPSRLLPLLAFGCGAGKADPVLPTIPITCAGRAMTVEVADDAALREHGLMEREALAPDSGMVFVYPAEGLRRFWMKNTLIPLAIAYVDSHGRIVHIAEMAALDTTPVSSQRPAMYAIEMSQGWFAAKGIQAGDRCEGLPGPSTQ